MIRGTLTLLNRSVRGDALKSHAHWSRLLSVLILLILLFIAHFRSTYAITPGLDFFRSMAHLGIALICLAGVGHFANSVTEEKEEGTLGLLLLANISPLAILLGKSTNRVLSAILIFAAQFPFALLSITLGGITITQIFATYISLAAFLFLIANLALLSSVVSRRSSEAGALMVLLTLVVMGMVPALDHFFSQLATFGYLSLSGSLGATLESLNAFHEKTSVIQQVSRIFEPNGTYAVFGLQVLYSLVAGVFFFLLAWLRFRQVVWTPESVEPQRVAISTRRRRWFPLMSRPWKVALAWKDFYFISGGPLLVIAKVIFYPLWISLCIYYSSKIHRVTMVSGEAFARDSLLVVLAIEVLLFASLFFNTERKLGTLPTLLMLPQSVGQLSYSKLLGCSIAVLPTIIALLGTEYLLKISGTGFLVVYTLKMVIGISIILVLSHLTVLCSLISKWGALPLAIGVMLILGMILAPFVAGAMTLISAADQGDLAEASPLIYATVIVCAAIQFEIARRIQLIAGS